MESIKKFAMVGSSCAGKTTIALDIAARLKYASVLAECVQSQDRRITWNPKYLPTHVEAQVGMITLQIEKEVQASLGGDASVVISDRSALDLYAYALVDFADSQIVKDLGVFVKSWLSTYERLYYLPPLPYQDDGKRPPDAFRTKVDSVLKNLLDSWSLPNLRQLPRHLIFKDVCEALNIEKFKKTFITDEEIQAIADYTGYEVVVKLPTSSSADLDLFVVGCPLVHLDSLRSLVKDSFGGYMKVDIHFSITKNTFDFPYESFLPKKS